MKQLFAAFGVLLLSVLALLAYVTDYSTSWMFYLIEGIIILTLIFLIILYRRVIKPLYIIGRGMELLEEQDFGSRLRKVKQREADRIVDIFNRMMEQLKNERLRLREQNHFLDLLINASPMGVIITSLNEEITQLNPMALKMLDIKPEDALGKKLADINSPIAAELLSLSKENTKTVRLNDSAIYKCTRSFFIDRGFRHPFYLIERLTDEVRKAEKKAYEKVIRMIAHEVNNTVAGVTSTLDTTEQTLSGMENADDICYMMRVCAERCYSMSRFITRFADVVKIPEPHLVPADLNELVLSCRHFMEGVCTERGIVIKSECEKRAINVNIDTALFEQVMVNIVKNAIESIERDGEITIRVYSPNSLEVIDTGKGIDKEAEDKLFTPFFSTKPHGQGIGLIFIREVLERHECTFSLRTYHDGLTRFRIQFS
ncbi:Sensor histidine kinase ResE [termite gut metagenome]|uniref:histidine kinase n=1 Tax=termite gut metagenome TaxID=433724 RepID=A0A5J4RTF2_9ZZZZ